MATVQDRAACSCATADSLQEQLHSFRQHVQVQIDTVLDAVQKLGVAVQKLAPPTLSRDSLPVHGLSVGQACPDHMQFANVSMREAPLVCTDQALLSAGLKPTAAMAGLITDLNAAQGYFGCDNFQQILRHISTSEAQTAQSVQSLANALVVADTVPLPELQDVRYKHLSVEVHPANVLKRAKLALRNSLVWRCIGWAQGMESEEAVADRFPIFRSEQTRAQLTNGLVKIVHSTCSKLVGFETHAVTVHKSRKRRGHRSACMVGSEEAGPPPPNSSPQKVDLSELHLFKTSSGPSARDPALVMQRRPVASDSQTVHTVPIGIQKVGGAPQLGKTQWQYDQTSDSDGSVKGVSTGASAASHFESLDV